MSCIDDPEGSPIRMLKDIPSFLWHEVWPIGWPVVLPVMLFITLLRFFITPPGHRND